MSRKRCQWVLATWRKCMPRRAIRDPRETARLLAFGSFSALVVLMAASCGAPVGGPGDTPGSGGVAGPDGDGIGGAGNSAAGGASADGSGTDGPLGTPDEMVLPFESQGRAGAL